MHAPNLMFEFKPYASRLKFYTFFQSNNKVKIVEVQKTHIK
jgi:hypothetical protein